MTESRRPTVAGRMRLRHPVCINKTTVCATNIVQIQVLICTSIGNIGKFPYWKRNPCLLGIWWACWEIFDSTYLAVLSQSVFIVMAIPAMRTQQLDVFSIWLECLQNIAWARACLERWSWRACGNGPSSLPSLCNQYHICGSARILHHRRRIWNKVTCFQGVPESAALIFLITCYVCIDFP